MTHFLADQKCVPCKGGVPPLKGLPLQQMSRQTPEWRVVEAHHIQRSFAFPDFAQGLAFANRVGAIAEAEGHHPDILLRWGKVDISIWTHKINGLTESDFILAAKIDRAL